MPDQNSNLTCQKKKKKFILFEPSTLTSTSSKLFHQVIRAKINIQRPKKPKKKHYRRTMITTPISAKLPIPSLRQITKTARSKTKLTKAGLASIFKLHSYLDLTVDKNTRDMVIGQLKTEIST